MLDIILKTRLSVWIFISTAYDLRSDHAVSRFSRPTMFNRISSLCAQSGPSDSVFALSQATFATQVAIMLMGMRMSIQAKLDTFFAHLRQQAQLVYRVSGQAFAQARAKLSLAAIPALND
jgi:hypothetical protein